MEIVIPKTITESVLVSSNVPENDYAAYNGSTTYATGSYCIVVATHRIYKSRKDANTGHYPPDNYIGTDPWWDDFGPTNKWKGFDDRVGTVTTGTDITFTLDSSKCDVVALFGLAGSSVLIETLSGGNVVDSRTISLAYRNTGGWYGWFFEDWSVLDKAKVKIPLLISSQVRVTIPGVGGYGNCVIGRSKFVGKLIYGSDKGLTSFSKKETDSFGYTYLKKGALKDILNVRLHTKANQRDYVENILRAIDGIPVVFLCDNTQDSALQMLQVYGALYDSRIVLEGPSADTREIRIESLI